MQKWKTWEEKTLRNSRKMLSQVERNPEPEDVQAYANRDGPLIDANHKSILLLQK